MTNASKEVECDKFPSREDLLRACSKIPGPNIFEIGPDNIWSCVCGSYELVTRDLQLVLSPESATCVDKMLRTLGVEHAFHVRKELVNFKKVMLYIYDQGVSLERSLAQLNTLLNYDARGGQMEFDCWSASVWSANLLDAHMQCKGRTIATGDVRKLCKDICALPRHPDQPRRVSLDRLPRSLQSWSISEGGCATLAAGAVVKQTPTLDVDAAVQQVREEMNKLSQLPLKSADLHSKLYAGIDVQEWPVHVKEFVKAVLLCRGGDKALRICDELQRLCQALSVIVEQGEIALEEFLALPNLEDASRDADFAIKEARVFSAQVAINHTINCKRDQSTCPRKVAIKAATWRQRHINLLSGCLPPLRESLRWLRAIEKSSGQSGSSSLFLAGDARDSDGVAPALCVPSSFSGCKVLDDAFKHVVQRYRPQMQQLLNEKGWPEHICPNVDLQDAPVHKKCRRCEKQFASALWVQKRVCSMCEEAFRDEGRCPFNTNCSPLWFCSHDHRCLSCDMHSCSQCRILRGDGEVVRDVAENTKFARICLDFDRTLANTKSGSSPIIGKHVIDMELLGLLQLHSESCAVVTRNSHKEEIAAFLQSHGVPDTVPVHTLRKPRSKAEFVVQGLETWEQALFVDDSIQELLDPRIVRDSRIQRILFVRALL